MDRIQPVPEIHLKEIKPLQYVPGNPVSHLAIYRLSRDKQPAGDAQIFDLLLLTPHLALHLYVHY